jgi:hypothetical protein
LSVSLSTKSAALTPSTQTWMCGVPDLLLIY